MTSPRRLGELEVIVLAAILRLGANAYGVPIRDEIIRVIGRDVSVGTLYKTLRRLEANGLVSTELGEPTATRGGRAKTYYRVEAAGGAALRTSVTDVRRMIDGIELGWGPS